MDIIAVDPGVHSDKPWIAGTRIAVQNVLEPVDEDFPFEQIVRDYHPDPAVDDVHTCATRSARSMPRTTACARQPSRCGSCSARTTTQRRLGTWRSWDTTRLKNWSFL